MKLVLEAFATRQPPRSDTQLLDRLTLHWADPADSDAGHLGPAPLSPARRNLADLLAAMPDVGGDADVQRHDDPTPWLWMSGGRLWQRQGTACH